MMFKTPLDLKHARIMISNDDGIHAEGIAALERVARSICDDVWVVAPLHEQSASSHSLTIHRPIRWKQTGEQRFAVDGTPTDCVLMGLQRLVPGKRPDLVLSGINYGSNLGDDVTYSGTIAAAMEATLIGAPAIAVSAHIHNGIGPCFDMVEALLPDVLRRCVATGWGRDVLLNINFPAVETAAEVTGTAIVRHGRHKIGDLLAERMDPRGKPYIWIGAARAEEQGEGDSDIQAIARGEISISALKLDLNDLPTLHKLQSVFAREAL